MSYYQLFWKAGEALAARVCSPINVICGLVQ